MNDLSGMLKSISTGDKDALTELYNLMHKEIYVFLLMFCKDKHTAEDIMQETFISVYENAGSYRVSGNPRAWIFTIAKNKALNIIKKESRTVNIDAPETGNLYGSENFENLILDKIQVDMLLSVLSETDRKIVILHAVYGFKHRETAELMGMPVGTIKWRYKQSIDKMKKKHKENNELFLKQNKQNEVILHEK